MRTTFGRFNKGLFLKVHRCTMVYYIIFNCELLTKFQRIFFESPAVSHNLIFDLQSWTAYADVSLILEKIFSTSIFYDIICFSILASEPNLDATIISDNFSRSSSIDAIIFNCGPLIMNASLDFEHFSGRFGVSPTIKGFQKVFLKKWKAAIIFPKILAYMIKIVKFLVCITFVP